MKRLLIAAMVGVLSAGCAEGIDDPQPGPDSPARNTPGAAQQFSAPLPDTRIDPTQLGTGVSTPKEELTYENPNAHPGWLGEKLNADVKPNIEVVDIQVIDDTQLENNVEINEAEQADQTFEDNITSNDLGPDNTQKKH